jgi:hypothetical protein
MLAGDVRRLNGPRQKNGKWKDYDRKLKRNHGEVYTTRIGVQKDGEKGVKEVRGIRVYNIFKNLGYVPHIHVVYICVCACSRCCVNLSLLIIIELLKDGM